MEKIDSITLTEKNEVIARFMGLVFAKEYHKSFEWLMPACQKFVSEQVNKLPAPYRNMRLKQVRDIDDAVQSFLCGNATILDIHQALYEGIEWLNKQTK